MGLWGWLVDSQVEPYLPGRRYAHVSTDGQLVYKDCCESLGAESAGQRQVRRKQQTRAWRPFVYKSTWIGGRQHRSHQHA